MKQYLTEIEPPEELPLTVADLKNHLRLRQDDATEDADLELIIDAARQEIDGAKGWLGRCLITQTWRLILDRFPSCGRIIIPLPPLQEIVSVSYIDTDGNTQTLTEGDDYRLVDDVEPAYIEPAYNQAFPSVRYGAAVRVEFTAGYGDADTDVPELIKKFLKIRCGDYYQSRESNVIGAPVYEVPHVRDSLEGLRIRAGTTDNTDEGTEYIYNAAW